MTRPTRRYLRFLALAAAAAALLGAAGWLPTRNLADGGGLAAMGAALALCWLASAFGGMPVLLAETANAAAGAAPRLPVVVALGSMGVRLAVVVGLALAAALSGLVATTPLLVWTALGYLGLLAVDTAYVLGLAKTTKTKTDETDDVTERA